jgi:hypothetical protein
MNSVEINSIIVRSLNHLRRTHLPSYIGLRRLLNSTSSDNIESWLPKYIINKSISSREQSYIKFKLFKGIRDEEPIYRECYAPSPTSALMEAFVLSLMSKFAVFKNTKNSYSYLWPESEKSGYSYQYFFDGYRRREKDIEQAILSNNNSVVYITDIRSFYPSIPKEILIKRFNQLVEQEGGDDYSKRMLTNTGHCLISGECAGIPIGSSLGHAMANIVLRELDIQFEHKNDISYFRYVDDIALVGNKASIENSINVISKYLDKYGLTLHSGKTEIIEGEKWVKSKRFYRELTEIGFEEWKQNLLFILAYSGIEFNRFKDILRSNDFNLPCWQFRSLIKYNRFCAFLKKFEYRFYNKKLKFPSLSDTIKEGSWIRDKAFQNLNIILSQPNTESNNELNIRNQAIKFLISRLIYLSPYERYGELISYIEGISEFKNIEVLIKSLLDGDVSEIMTYPGQTVNSFCQIFKDLNDGKKCIIKNIDDDASASSLHSMIIYGLVDYEDITKTNMNENDKHLARICAGQHKHEKSFDFKYLNEMNTLLLSSNQISNEDIINSRFSDGEEVVLDATLLDSLNSY